MSEARKGEEDNGKESTEGQQPARQEEGEEEEESCAICMMPLDDEQMRCKLLSCQHDYFHYDCLMKWARIRLNCPLCKIALTSISYGDRVVHIESFLASQNLQQGQNQINNAGSGMRVDDDEYDDEDDDYEEDEEEEDFDACAVCGEECVPIPLHGHGPLAGDVSGGALSEMGPSVFCNCGVCVHLSCIGRR